MGARSRVKPRHACTALQQHLLQARQHGLTSVPLRACRSPGFVHRGGRVACARGKNYMPDIAKDGPAPVGYVTSQYHRTSSPVCGHMP